MIKVAGAGRRQLQESSKAPTKAQPVCKNGGQATTCDDGVKPGSSSRVLESDAIKCSFDRKQWIYYHRGYSLHDGIVRDTVDCDAWVP